MLFLKSKMMHILYIVLLSSIVSLAAEYKQIESGLVSTSSHESSDLMGHYAFDGNEFTRWASIFNDNEWIEVDLHKTFAIDKIVLKWEAAYARQFRIHGSENHIDWVELHANWWNESHTNILENEFGKYRYIKIELISRATSYGYSLFEIEIFTKAKPDIEAQSITLDSYHPYSGSYLPACNENTAGKLIVSDGGTHEYHAHSMFVCLSRGDAVTGTHYGWVQVANGQGIP